MEKHRIESLREYLFNIIDGMIGSDEYQINANMLSDNVGDYSLDKIPTESVMEKWIIGPSICQDTYSFRSRKAYSQDVINNLSNIGFFEDFERIIKANNNNKILPDIEGIESIQCLNPGTLNNSETGTAEFDIQIRITYREDDDGSERRPSL